MDKYEYKGWFYSKLFDTIIAVCKYGMMTLVAYFVYKIFDGLAGQTTWANIMVGVIWPTDNTDKTKNVALGLLTTYSGLITWYVKWKIKKLHSHNRELELIVNKKRKGSKLTSSGSTNPMDK